MPEMVVRHLYELKRPRKTKKLKTVICVFSLGHCVIKHALDLTKHNFNSHHSVVFFPLYIPPKWGSIYNKHISVLALANAFAVE